MGFGPNYSVFLGKAATTGNCSRATDCVAQASQVNLILLTPSSFQVVQVSLQIILPIGKIPGKTKNQKHHYQNQTQLTNTARIEMVSLWYGDK